MRVSHELLFSTGLLSFARCRHSCRVSVAAQERAAIMMQREQSIRVRLARWHFIDTPFFTQDLQHPSQFVDLMSAQPLGELGQRPVGTVSQRPFQLFSPFCEMDLVCPAVM